MLSIIRHEAMYYFKNKAELIEIYCFIMTIFLLFSFGLRSALTVNFELSLASLWLAMAIVSALGASSLYERDRSAGRLELYQLLPASLESIALGKWLAFYLALIVPLLLVIPLFGLFFHQEGLMQLAVGLGFGAFDMSLITCFSAAMMAGGGRGSALLSLISLPLMVPVMVFGTAYCRQPDLIDQSLLFLGAYGLLLLPLMAIASASSIRAAN